MVRSARSMPPPSPDSHPVDRRRDISIGVLCLVVTSVGWGLNWPAMKLLLHDWPPLFARGLAGVIAAVLVAAAAVVTGQALAVPRRLWGALLAATLYNVVAWMGFSSLSLRWLSAGQGAMLVYTMPVWASLFAWPLTGRRPGGRGALGLVLCMARVGLLFAGSSGHLVAAQWPGVLFALAAAVSFAFGTVVSKPLLLPPLTSVAWQLALGCGPMVLLGAAVEQPRLSALTPAGGAVMVYMTLVPMALCYLTWFAALRRIPPTLASISSVLTPAVGVTAAAFALGERFGLKEAVALGLTLAGVGIALSRVGEPRRASLSNAEGAP